MVAVGIKELKAKLSSYIDRAEHGEEIVVTEHGREVAMVIPISPERRALSKLEKAGKARSGSGKPRGASGIVITGMPLSETVLEKRR